jgi:hypothetical protein
MLFVVTVGAERTLRGHSLPTGTPDTMGAAMSKFLYLYRGPATPIEEFTAEQSAEQMRLWGEWMGQVGSAMVDAGAPFGNRASVADDGSSAEPTDLNGYTIVEAGSLDEAHDLIKAHPFLSEGKGRFTIDIYELIPMQM